MMNPEHISDSRTANQMALFSMKSMQHICLGRLTTAKGSTLFETLPTLVSLCERIILRPAKIEDIPIIFQIEDAKTMVAGVDFK